MNGKNNDRAYSQNLRRKKPKSAEDIYKPDWGKEDDDQELVSLTFKLSKELKERLRVAVVLNHMKMGVAGREAITDWVEKHEKI